MCKYWKLWTSQKQLSYTINYIYKCQHPGVEVRFGEKYLACLLEQRDADSVPKNKKKTTDNSGKRRQVLCSQLSIRLLSGSFPHTDSTVIQRMHWLNHWPLCSIQYLSLCWMDHLQNCSSKFPVCKQIVTTSWEFLSCDMFAPYQSYITCSLLQPGSSLQNTGNPRLVS